MKQVTCSSCDGSGIVRVGTVIGPIDLNYDTSAERSVNQECARRGLALLAMAKPGDLIEYSGQFSHRVIEVGMYDGWPFWKPTPAACLESPLGGRGDWQFYYYVTGLKPQGSATWIRRAELPTEARP